jgi:hypothetical protein
MLCRADLTTAVQVDDLLVLFNFLKRLAQELVRSLLTLIFAVYRPITEILILGRRQTPVKRQE